MFSNASMEIWRAHSHEVLKFWMRFCESSPYQSTSAALLVTCLNIEGRRLFKESGNIKKGSCSIGMGRCDGTKSQLPVEDGIESDGEFVVRGR